MKVSQGAGIARDGRSARKKIPTSATFIEDPVALRSGRRSPPTSFLKEQVMDVLASLAPRGSARLLELRFGLEDGRSRTLEEVGREFST